MPYTAGRRGSSGQRGQAIPLVVLLVLVAASLLVVAAEIGHRLDAAAQARTAADAAALAGAAGGREEAAEVAAANAAVLVSYREIGAVVEVTVRWRSATARARAEAVAEIVGPDAIAAATG